MDWRFSIKFSDRSNIIKIRVDIGVILRKLCEQKGVNIIEAEACPDHIHMLVEIPSKLSAAQFMGYLKGKSSLMIFDRHANLKYKYGNRHFWCRGYYADTVGKNEKRIAEYLSCSKLFFIIRLYHIYGANVTLQQRRVMNALIDKLKMK